MSLFHTIRYHSKDRESRTDADVEDGGKPLWYWEALLKEHAEPDRVEITGPKQGILHVWEMGT